MRGEKREEKVEKGEEKGEEWERGEKCRGETDGREPIEWETKLKG